MFSPKVTLQDPFVGKVEGKEEVLKIYQQIFEGNVLDVKILRKLQVGQCFAVEFRLGITDKLGNKSIIEGIDLIKVVNNQIESLRAYLDTKG